MKPLSVIVLIVYSLGMYDQDLIAGWAIIYALLVKPSTHAFFNPTDNNADE